MGMTITEKIMARNSGRASAVPGELVWTDVHTVMTMDFLGKQCFNKFRSLGTTEVFDKDRVICVSDHLVPPPTQKFANMLNEWREVVKEHGITNFYDLGRQGIAHQIMVEEGHVLPGKISIGTDSQYLWCCRCGWKCYWGYGCGGCHGNWQSMVQGSGIC